MPFSARIVLACAGVSINSIAPDFRSSKVVFPRACKLTAAVIFYLRACLAFFLAVISASLAEIDSTSDIVVTCKTPYLEKRSFPGMTESADCCVPELKLMPLRRF